MCPVFSVKMGFLFPENMFPFFSQKLYGSILKNDVSVNLLEVRRNGKNSKWGSNKLLCCITTRLLHSFLCWKSLKCTSTFCVSTLLQTANTIKLTWTYHMNSKCIFCVPTVFLHMISFIKHIHLPHESNVLKK